MTNAVNVAALGSTGVSTAFKNRIINGAMTIDQRNAGASVTPATAQYTLDRWTCSMSQASKFSIQQNAGSVTPPAGFVNYLGVTSLAATSVGSTDNYDIRQLIEGYNVADLGWGTANAKTVTLSFWVRSSLTGTFGGSLANGSFNRSYPFNYTISSANTWEQKSITIAGDISGTWTTTNGIGIYLFFSLGTGSSISGTANTWAGAGYVAPTGSTQVVATNGATFYITGVQLEVGSAATSFDTRSYGQELQLCQRYYQKYDDSANTNYSFIWTGYIPSATASQYCCSTLPPMRTAPSGTILSYNVSSMGTPTVATTAYNFVRFACSGVSSDTRAYFQVNASFSAEL